MKSIALFKEYITADFQRYEPRPFFPYFFLRMTVYPYFRLLVIYRFLTCFGRCGGGILWWLLKIYYAYLQRRILVELPLSVKIGKGCMFNHYGPRTFNPGTIIGENATIFPSVLIGSVRGKTGVSVPRIGDNVFLGAGCKILGGVHVGNYTFICPNSVVVKDVPDGDVVSGIPAKRLNGCGKKNVELYL